MTSARDKYAADQQALQTERSGRTEHERCACEHLKALHVKSAEACAAWADNGWCACQAFHKAESCPVAPDATQNTRAPGTGSGS